MTANDVAYQLTPKEKHSHNSSDKSIQTWNQLTPIYHCQKGANLLNKVTLP